MSMNPVSTISLLLEEVLGLVLLQVLLLPNDSVKAVFPSIIYAVLGSLLEVILVRCRVQFGFADMRRVVVLIGDRVYLLQRAEVTLGLAVSGRRVMERPVLRRAIPHEVRVHLGRCVLLNLLGFVVEVLVGSFVGDVSSKDMGCRVANCRHAECHLGSIHLVIGVQLIR